MQKYLDNIILELTKEIQEKTVEWVFQAIEKTREIEITLYQKANDLALEKFPNDRRERVYAVPSIIKFSTVFVAYYMIASFRESKSLRY